MLTGSFIAPFLMAFCVALFVLIMIFFWTYIDDIVGKGVGFWMLTELVFYLSISMVPMSLSIAILLASVMVMGNLAEHYELASFKSAGVPLSRIMVPLIIVGAGISLFSFFCSNNLIPIANLKFKSRLYDIRKQKPTLSLEKGIFNYDFKGFVIRIGEKEEDDRTIKDVLIYDHNKYNKGGSTRILAKEGEMYTTADKRFFIMNLTEGTQYQEVERASKGEKSYPFVRTNFKEWSKVFDLGEFEINRTDEKLFKTHQSMLTSAQLDVAIDSIENKITTKHLDLANFLNRNYYPFNERAIELSKQKQKLNKTETKRPPVQNKTVPVTKSKKENASQSQGSTSEAQKRAAETIKKAREDRKSPKVAESKSNATPTKVNPPSPLPNSPNKKNSKQLEKIRRVNKKIVEQKIDKPLKEYESWAETITKADRIKLYSQAKSTTRTLSSQADATLRTIEVLKESRVKHIYSKHEKYSLAAVCIIFLFIGAPMGAIIRKGGFGYPILVSIIFFILYVILNILFKKLAESFVVPPVLANWAPNLIMLPIGIILTYRAMNDSKVLNFDRLFVFLKKITALLTRKKPGLSNE